MRTSEATIHRCFTILILKMWQTLQENTKPLFNIVKSQAPCLQIYLKKTVHVYSYEFCQIFKSIFFCRSAPGDCLLHFSFFPAKYIFQDSRFETSHRKSCPVTAKVTKYFYLEFDGVFDILPTYNTAKYVFLHLQLFKKLFFECSYQSSCFLYF